jgi:uncharacterized protein (TIGR02246 family)
MKPKILTLVFAAAIGFAAQTFQSTAQEGTQTMNQAEIQATIDANNNAVASQDMDAILATYEPAATMLAQPGMPASGTDALRESFKYFLALNPKITVTKSDLVQSGNIALHSYTWTMSGKAQDGSPIQQSGLSLNVLRKQPDGRWLIVIDNPFGESVLKK